MPRSHAHDGGRPRSDASEIETWMDIRTWAPFATINCTNGPEQLHFLIHRLLANLLRFFSAALISESTNGIKVNNAAL